MRLTVHVTEAKRYKVEVKTKEGSVHKMKTFNTLTFHNVEESDLGAIKEMIKSDKLGKYQSHYFSNERISGRARGKKKS